MPDGQGRNADRTDEGLIAAPDGPSTAGHRREENVNETDGPTVRVPDLDAVTGSFFELCHDLLAIAGPDGRLERVNPSWERTLGWSQEEISSRSFLDFVHPDDLERTRAEAERAFSKGWIALGFTNRFRCRDGSYRWLEWNSREGPDGRIYCCARDVTDRREREERLEVLERAVESTRCGLLITDARHPENPIGYVNAGFEKITGYRAHEVVGRSCRVLQAGDRDQAGLHELRAAIHENRNAKVTLRNYRKDGALFMNQLSITPVRGGDGNSRNFVGIVVDVTEQMRLAEDLQLLMDRMPTGVLYVEPDYRIRFVNQAYCNLLELPREEVIRREVKEILTPEGWGRAHGWLRKAFDGFEHSVEAQPGLASRPHAVFRLRHVPERDPGGNVVGCLVLIDDVTNYMLKQEDLDRQAHQDPLTGLLNLRGFERALDDAVSRSVERQESNVLCIVDLDRFKPINDNCGHAKGDEALNRVAVALKSAVRGDDPVARIGGDEFAVLLQNCPVRQAKRSVRQLIAAVSGIRTRCNGREFALTASVGLVAFEGEGDRGRLIRSADKACYRAKRAGGNRFRTADPIS